jgi:hypothetical protein
MVAQPQLRRTPHASWNSSAGGRGRNLPVAGSAGHGPFGASGGEATKGCQSTPTRSPYSCPSLTGGMLMGERSYSEVW